MTELQVPLWLAAASAASVVALRRRTDFHESIVHARCARDHGWTVYRYLTQDATALLSRGRCGGTAQIQGEKGAASHARIGHGGIHRNGAHRGEWRRRARQGRRRCWCQGRPVVAARRAFFARFGAFSAAAAACGRRRRRRSSGTGLVFGAGGCFLQSGKRLGRRNLGRLQNITVLSFLGNGFQNVLGR